MSKGYIDGCDCWDCRNARKQEEMSKQSGINQKFEYCGYAEGTSDKEFLGWIYARLNSVFGERISLDYMKRLENIIDGMEQSKMINSEMTKEEAKRMMIEHLSPPMAERWLDIWEKLGIVKFKNEPVEKLWFQHATSVGTISLEKWPEGFVLWADGRIVYKSWENKDDGIEIKKRREAFRQSLADTGMPEHTLYSSPVLKAFDNAFGLR